VVAVINVMVKVISYGCRYTCIGLGEEEEEAADLAYDRLIMPKLVVSLDASDEFLRERVMNLPEIVVVGTHNTDEAFTRRLTDYRAINTDDETVLNYFDELEFHPERIGSLQCRIVIIIIIYFARKIQINFLT